MWDRDESWGDSQDSWYRLTPRIFEKKCAANWLVGWARRALWSFTHMSFISGSGTEELSPFSLRTEGGKRIKHLFVISLCGMQSLHRYVINMFMSVQMRPVTIWITFNVHGCTHTFLCAECVLLWSVGPSELGGCRPESSESELKTQTYIFTQN